MMMMMMVMMMTMMMTMMMIDPRTCFVGCLYTRMGCDGLIPVTPITPSYLVTCTDTTTIQSFGFKTHDELHPAIVVVMVVIVEIVVVTIVEKVVVLWW